MESTICCWFVFVWDAFQHHTTQWPFQLTARTVYTMRYRRAVTNHAILMNIREWNARQIRERINTFFKRLESQLLSSQNSQKLTRVDNTNADSVLLSSSYIPPSMKFDKVNSEDISHVLSYRYSISCTIVIFFTLMYTIGVPASQVCEGSYTAAPWKHFFSCW